MKLNIGSCQKRLEHYQNIDKFPSELNDIYGNLDQKIDLPDACADEIMLDNVIEHVESAVHAIKEVRRLLKIGGVVHIYTPHFTSQSSWRDPTYRHHLSYFSFDIFFRAKNAHYLGGKLILSMLGRLIFKISPEAYKKSFVIYFELQLFISNLKQFNLHAI
ncbi:Methyltransferase type 11 [Candidatus Methylopumilus planktonicus]|uniref:class I SAM-dependent methyltransferase n=1 Tax=Candidatus Methylopumilus planktonicus TaxID=1581557 RepID=UPI003BEEDC97